MVRNQPDTDVPAPWTRSVQVNGRTYSAPGSVSARNNRFTSWPSPHSKRARSIASFRELVRELHRNPAAERLSDNGRPIVAQGDHQVAEVVRDTAERVVAAWLRGPPCPGISGRTTAYSARRARAAQPPVGRLPAMPWTRRTTGRADLCACDRVPVNGDFSCNS